MTADPGRRPRLLAATAMATAPLLALIVARIAWAGDLPPAVASHWSNIDSADGFSDTDIYFHLVLALTCAAAVSSVLAAALANKRPGGLVWMPTVTVVSGTFAATWIVSVVTTNAAGDPRQANLGWWIAVPLLATAWGLAIFAVLPRRPSGRVDEPAPTLERPLLPGERAVWFGRVTTPWMAWLAGAIVIGAVAAIILTPAVWPILTLALTALMVGGISDVTVRADHDGVSLS